MEQPRQGDGQHDGQQRRGPVTQVVGTEPSHHKVVVDEICLQTQSAEESPETVDALGQSAKYSIEQQNGCQRQRDINHALYEKWEKPVRYLFEIDARCETCHKGDQGKPYGSTVDAHFTTYHFTEIDAKEEDGHAAPEDFQMSHSMVDGYDPLHHDTPQHHQYHRPTIDGVLGDEFHIRWCPEIKHHDGGNIPKSQLVVKPEIPVDGDITDQIDDTPGLRIEAWNIVERCHDEPRRQDAQQATTIETPGGRLLHPGEPKAYATKKEKYIDTDIATATEAKKQNGAG